MRGPTQKYDWECDLCGKKQHSELEAHGYYPFPDYEYTDGSDVYHSAEINIGTGIVSTSMCTECYNKFVAKKKALDMECADRFADWYHEMKSRKNHSL